MSFTKRTYDTTPTNSNLRRSTLTTVMCNAILVVALVACLLLYITASNKDIYEQNIETLTNIASAKADLMALVRNDSNKDIIKAYNWCEGKSEQEILTYLSTICSDSDDEYQLLHRDNEQSTSISAPVYVGYSTKKVNNQHLAVRYNNTRLTASLEQNKDLPNGKVVYSQSFTNSTDPLYYYSALCSISVNTGSGEATYFLIKPQQESLVMDYLRTVSQYDSLTTAVCYTDGRYLARDASFRADNFFDHLKNHNQLSLEQRNQIKANLLADEDGKGLLEYKNAAGYDCAYAYASNQEDSDWFIVVSAPVSEFIGERFLALYPFIMILLLIVLLLFNVFRLLGVVNQLRVSVENEIIANEAKSSFLSRISHEIRTPLNAVIGYNAIARNTLSAARNDDDARRQAEGKVADCLTKSEIASKHLLTIINDVLDMSAIESGKIKAENERFDFKGLITSLSTVFYSQAKAKGVDFEVIFGTHTEEWFVGDQMRISQILTNLLANAVKFTDVGGIVKLVIGEEEVKGTNKTNISFAIQDTGIGMSEDYIEHIWTPFEQADSSITRRFGGSGLGLSITKSLVNILGGTISVSSVLGKGTTFEVSIALERTHQPSNAEVYDFSSINALVVDDDASTCDYIRLLFNRCGVRCVAVNSGADAIKAVSIALEQKDAFTICLIDWRMPDIDGIETIKRIKSITNNDIPIIVLTAYDYSELADTAHEIGISKFISKPLFQSSLFDLLATVSGMDNIKSIQKNDSIDFEGARVLLAEDNEMNMEIAKTLMESVGLVVDSAWNGKEAVEMFTSAPANTYSAILMDVHMPVLNGHEATKTIRASSHPQAQSIPIIAMTAAAFAVNVAESQAAGMNAHIGKPIDTHILFSTLKQYILKEGEGE